MPSEWRPTLVDPRIEIEATLRRILTDVEQIDLEQVTVSSEGTTFRFSARFADGSWITADNVTYTSEHVQRFRRALFADALGAAPKLTIYAGPPPVAFGTWIDAEQLPELQANANPDCPAATSHEPIGATMPFCRHCGNVMPKDDQ